MKAVSPSLFLFILFQKSKCRRFLNGFQVESCRSCAEDMQGRLSSYDIDMGKSNDLKKNLAYLSIIVYNLFLRRMVCEKVLGGYFERFNRCYWRYGANGFPVVL